MGDGSDRFGVSLVGDGGDPRIIWRPIGVGEGTQDKGEDNL